MESLSDAESLPDIVVTEDELVSEQSDEEINFSDAGRVGNPFAGLNADGFPNNSILFPRITHSRPLGINPSEESKAARNFSDWMRYGERIVGGRSEHDFLSSGSDSDSTHSWDEPGLLENTGRFEYKNVHSYTVKGLLECKICYGQMRDNLM